MKTIIITVLALGLLACGKEGDAGVASTAPAADKAPAAEPAPAPAEPAASIEPSEPAATEPAETEPAADVAPEATAVADEVPTAEDFEEKAASSVDKANLETEVSRMEKELGVKNK